MRLWLLTFIAFGTISGSTGNSKPSAGVHYVPPPAAPKARPIVRTPRRGGYLPWGGGQMNSAPKEVYVEVPVPASGTPKDLVVSPTYEKPKIQPKMVEIP